MNRDNFVIRRETPADYRAVEELVRESFWNVSRPSGVWTRLTSTATSASPSASMQTIGWRAVSWSSATTTYRNTISGT